MFELGNLQEQVGVRGSKDEGFGGTIFFVLQQRQGS